MRYSLPTLALAKSTDAVMLLDGDQRIVEADWSVCDSTPANTEHNAEWENHALDLLGCVPQHFANSKDGSSDDASVVKNLREILLWARQNIYYLNGNVPEAAILAETEKWDPNSTTSSAKARFVEIARAIFGHSKTARVPASDILNAQRIHLGRLDESSPLIKSAFAAVDAVR